MKRIFLLILLVLSQGVISCTSKDEPKEPQGKPGDDKEDPQDENEEEQTLTVSFQLTGEYNDLQNSETSKDLLGIQVFDLESHEPYAFVLADDITQLSLEVEQGKTYQFITSYVRNGKELIESENGRWLQPFGISDASHPVPNKFVYSSFVRFAGLDSPEIEMIGEESQVYLPVDRYHSLSEITIREGTKEIAIDFKRMVVGIDFNINLGEATLIKEVLFRVGIPGSAGREYIIDLEKGQGSLNVPYLSMAVPEANLNDALAEDYSEEVFLSLGTLEEPGRFVNETMEVFHNILLELNFSSEEGHPNMSFELEEGELVPGEGSLHEY